jgi:hypothetical protein
MMEFVNMRIFYCLLKIWQLLVVSLIIAVSGCNSKPSVPNQSQTVCDLPDSLRITPLKSERNQWEFLSEVDKWDYLYNDTLTILHKIEKSQSASSNKKNNANYALEILKKVEAHHPSSPVLIEASLKLTKKGIYVLKVLAFNMNRELNSVVISGIMKNGRKIKIIFKIHILEKDDSMIHSLIWPVKIVDINSILENKNAKDCGDEIIVEYDKTLGNIFIPDMSNMTLYVTDRLKGASSYVEIERD